LSRAKIFFKRQHDKFCKLLYSGDFYSDVGVNSFDLEAIELVISAYERELQAHLPELINKFNHLKDLATSACTLDCEALTMKDEMDLVSDQQAFSKATQMMVMMAKLNMAYADFKESVRKYYLAARHPTIFKCLKILNLELNPIDHGNKDLNMVSAELRNYMRLHGIYFRGQGGSPVPADSNESAGTTELDLPKSPQAKLIFK
jgi:hypothetical protein